MAHRDNKESGFVSMIKSLAIAIVIAMIFRTFIYAPFYIPSGSMKPNLQEGDFIFVSKFAYGYSHNSFSIHTPFFSLPFPEMKERLWFTPPERGDVVVFALPGEEKTNYIKRLIGLPGDTVQMKNGVVYINGEAVPKQQLSTYFLDEAYVIAQYNETLPNHKQYTVLDSVPEGEKDNTEVYRVPDKHYFFLGDNRDGSKDSRFMDGVGFVPEVNLIGRAEVIFLSRKDIWGKIWYHISKVMPSSSYSYAKSL